MMYSRPTMTRADLMIEHCMCCLVKIGSDDCDVGSPVRNPFGPIVIEQ